VSIPEALLGSLGAEAARTRGLLPLRLDEAERRLTVAMVDPLDRAVLSPLLDHVGADEARVLLARREALFDAIDRNFAATVETDPPRPQAVDKVQVDLSSTVEPSGVRRLSLVSPPSVEAKALTDERALSSALLEIVEQLGLALARRLDADAPVEVSERGRLARSVARELGLPRRTVEEIGLAAQLYALDRRLGRPGAESELLAELGWAAAEEGGVLSIVRALSAPAEGFERPREPVLGARVVGLIEEYLELGAASGGRPEGLGDLGVVSQLLRASSAGVEVVDALLRVLERDHVHRVDPSGLHEGSAAGGQTAERTTPEGPTLEGTTIERNKNAR
jgi:hypothetical protein